MNTRSIATSRQRRVRASDPCRPARRAVALGLGAFGRGNDAASMGAACSGLTPQVTIGAISRASSRLAIELRVGVAAEFAPSPRPPARSPRPWARTAGPCNQANVVSSGATSPSRAPAFNREIAERHAPLHRQAAHGSAGVFDRVALRAVRAHAGDDRERDILRGHLRRPSAPSTVIRMRFGFFCQSVCVISTCATSEAPMPKAYAPNAPWVEVWLSPQTTVSPGSVKTQLGRGDMHDAAGADRRD